MVNLRKISVILLALTALVSCRDFTKPLFGDDIIARAGGKTLYIEDVKGIFPEGITAEDSVRLLESFADQWVKKQLKVEAAEEMFAKSQDDIEQMVEDYRNSLLTYKVDQAQIDKTLDTLCTAEEITAFYKDNINDFVLDRPLFKGRMVVVPASFRQQKKLSELITASDGDERQDFVDICMKNNFPLREFASWTELSELVALLPKKATPEFTSGKLLKIEDRDDIYYVYFPSLLRVGDHTPEERVSDVIRRVLINKRKENIIRNLEDSLFTKAKLEKSIVINVHKR